MRKEITGLFIASIVLGLYAAAWAGSATCNVLVVDARGEPIADAEVVVYEEKYDHVASQQQSKILCRPQKTNPQGQVRLQFECRDRERGMVVVRKAGYAMGWDRLPYREFAAPKAHIVLDKPQVLAGRLLDKKGRPVAGASVQVQPKTCKLDRLEQRPVLGPADWLTVQTDANGRFEINCFGSDVSADFVVTPPDSQTAYKYTTHYLSGCGYEVGREDISLVLPKQTTVNVQVVNDRNHGIAGMTVVMRPDHRGNHFQMDYTSRQAVTDEKGGCSFEHIPFRNHYLSVLNTDPSVPWVDKTLCIKPADLADPANFRIQLETGPVVQITMRDEFSQKPVEDMYVSLSQEPTDPNVGWFSRSFYTDSDGQIRAVVPAGRCNFSYWDDRYERRELELPEFEKGKSYETDFSVTPKKPISGRVEHPDQTPATGCTVKMTWGRNVLTDSDGTFECMYDELREGMCLIARDEENNRTAVIPVGKPDEPAVLTLQPARTLKGRITDPNGAPIPAARVEIHFSGPGYLSDCCPEILADRDGRFEVRAIAAALPEGFGYRISTGTMNHGARTYQRLQIQEQTDALIQLQPIQMSPAELTIDGIVVRPDGTPAADLPIFLQGTGQYHQRTVTDEEGRFRLRRLCAGQIRLQAGISGIETERGFVTANSGDTEVKIILGQRRVHVPPPVSLMHHRLPAWDSIEFESALPIKHSLLVCFWDFAQRPSRHGVGQLADMKQAFAEKRIEVILIHTTQMNDDAKKWIEEKQLDCHVGYLPTESESIRQKWGVQSLPWLILTDAEHVITDEGFSVIALEEKLKTK